jgi:hypothetical protein
VQDFNLFFSLRLCEKTGDSQKTGSRNGAKKKRKIQVIRQGEKFE